jgi:hypothetical protein
MVKDAPSKIEQILAARLYKLKSVPSVVECLNDDTRQQGDLAIG